MSSTSTNNSTQITTTEQKPIKKQKQQTKIKIKKKILSTKQPRFTNEERCAIINMKKTNKSLTLRDIATQYKVSREAIRKILKNGQIILSNMEKGLIRPSA